MSDWNHLYRRKIPESILLIKNICHGFKREEKSAPLILSQSHTKLLTVPILWCIENFVVMMESPLSLVSHYWTTVGRT